MLSILSFSAIYLGQMPGRSDPNVYYSLCKHQPFLLRDCGVGERPGISRLIVVEGRREDKWRWRRATRFSVERKGETANIEYCDKASVWGTEEENVKSGGICRIKQNRRGNHGTGQRFTLRYVATRDRYAIWFGKEWTGMYNLGTLSFPSGLDWIRSLIRLMDEWCLNDNVEK